MPEFKIVGFILVVVGTGYRWFFEGDWLFCGSLIFFGLAGLLFPLKYGWLEEHLHTHESTSSGNSTDDP